MSDLLFIEKIFVFVENNVHKMFDMISNIDYQSLAVRGFLFYGHCMSKMNGIYNNLYKKYKFVRNMSYTVNYTFRYMRSLFFLYKIEPFFIDWYSNGWIDRTSIDQYTYNEKVLMFSKENPDILVDDIVSNWIIDPIFLGKLEIPNTEETAYICRRINEKDIEIPDFRFDLFPVVPSSAHFLSITYKHPLMYNTIELSLEKEWFIDGNEILTPSFVHRALDYQSNGYIFDMSYQIVIIDANIQVIELTSNQYVVLLKNGYEIVDISEKPVSLEYDILEEDETTTKYSDDADEIQKIKSLEDVSYKIDESILLLAEKMKKEN